MFRTDGHGWQEREGWPALAAVELSLCGRTLQPGMR